MASPIAGPQKAWMLIRNICVKLCCHTRFHRGTVALYSSMSTAPFLVLIDLDVNSSRGGGTLESVIAKRHGRLWAGKTAEGMGRTCLDCFFYAVYIYSINYLVTSSPNCNIKIAISQLRSQHPFPRSRGRSKQKCIASLCGPYGVRRVYWIWPQSYQPIV